MKVAVLSPTTSQLVEKMAALFPEGVDLVGPQADDRHYWNNCHLRLKGWQELGLRVTIVEQPFEEIDFHKYDLLVQSAETFWYSKDWANHCLRVECPIVLKACWTNTPEALMPFPYIKKVREFPVLLEMPAHEPNWKKQGFRDVNVIPNPVGDWWFKQEWTGAKEQVLFVLSGKDSWRGLSESDVSKADPSWNGLDLWEKLCREFPGKTYHHDGDKGYKTPQQMTELFAESRVFANFDRPFGWGERPLTLAFTEALSVGLPVVTRDEKGMNYRWFIDSNGTCSNDFKSICTFVEKCLTDAEYARACSIRSREIGRQAFSFDALRPRYAEIVSRAQIVFAEQEQRRKRSFAFLTAWLPSGGTGKKRVGRVFKQLRELYEKSCPANYVIETQIQTFYSSREYWEKFREWERTNESYSIRDKAFVESVFKMDDADVVNIGCFYPWAEIEWGKRVRQWTAIDINKEVLDGASRALREYPSHRVTFLERDVTMPIYVGRRVDCVLDLSTGDQLDPRKLWNVLCNYMRLSDRLLMAYDATNEPLAVFDFKNYGFNALYNPKTMLDVLASAGYRIVDHRPFHYNNRSYVAAELLPASDLGNSPSASASAKD
jgi:hypothetical protein